MNTSLHNVVLVKNKKKLTNCKALFRTFFTYSFIMQRDPKLAESVGIVESETVGGQRKCLHAVPERPSTAPDPKTVEIVQYYRQARLDHDFKLIEVGKPKSIE